MNKKQTVCFHGVMHFTLNEGNNTNHKEHDPHAAFGLYIKNSITLALSLKRHGYAFTLHTNDVVLCTKLLGSGGCAFINVVQLESYYTPPADINFYSAHQKLNLYRTLASSREGIHCVVDLDMVMLQKLPEWLHEVWESGKGTVYDITSQVVPSVGHGRIRSDLMIITGGSCEGRWFGGEFIAGSGRFWAVFCGRIEKLWAGYESHYQELSHQGDEALSSAALQSLNGDECLALDVGVFDVVKRHWSVCTNHEQTSLDQCRGNLSLLHLPADKHFLAQRKDGDFDNANEVFYKQYRIEYVRRKVLSLVKLKVNSVLLRKK